MAKDRKRRKEPGKLLGILAGILLMRRFSLLGFLALLFFKSDRHSEFRSGLKTGLWATLVLALVAIFSFLLLSLLAA